MQPAGESIALNIHRLEVRLSPEIQFSQVSLTSVSTVLCRDSEAANHRRPAAWCGI
jgi:hypothetical protein